MTIFHFFLTNTCKKESRKKKSAMQCNEISYLFLDVKKSICFLKESLILKCKKILLNKF